jgi:hypothetical protein
MKWSAAARVLASSIVVLAACNGREEEISPPPAPSEPSAPPAAPASHGNEQATSPQPSAHDVVTSQGGAASEPSDLVAIHPVTTGTDCESIDPRALGVVNERLYWQVDCWRSGRQFRYVASVAAAGGPLAIITMTPLNLYMSIGAHVVLRRESFENPADSYVSVVPAGTTTEVVLPDSSDCLATASDAGHVYCLSAHWSEPRELRSWTIDGAGPSVIATFDPDASTLAADATRIYVGHHGSEWPTPPKMAPRPKRDGKISAVDSATGVVAPLYESVAPMWMKAYDGVVSWFDSRWIDENGDPHAPRELIADSSTTPIESGLWDPSMGAWTITAFDSAGAETVVWALATEPKSDRILSPSLRVHYLVAPKYEVAALAVDATHVYRLTLQGVFRRPK